MLAGLVLVVPVVSQAAVLCADRSALLSGYHRLVNCYDAEYRAIPAF